MATPSLYAQLGEALAGRRPALLLCMAAGVVCGFVGVATGTQFFFVCAIAMIGWAGSALLATLWFCPQRARSFGLGSKLPLTGAAAWVGAIVLTWFFIAPFIAAVGFALD